MTPMYDLDELSLSSPLGETSPADPDDVLRAKHAFRKLRYYEVPSYGLTPYPDQSLFDGIRAYQKDKNLTVDGLMMPAGETEQSVNNSLAADASKPENVGEGGCAEEAVSILPGYPWIRRRNYCPVPRSREDDGEDGDERQQRCWEQYLNDNRRCGRLRSLPGRPAAQRRARCRASASERFAACNRGKNLPDLDTGIW